MKPLKTTKGMLLADYGRYVLLPQKNFAGFVPPKPFIADSIGHHNHAVEDALIRRVVKRRQSVRQPADRIALAAARRVLDEVVVTYAVTSRSVHEHSHRLELVVAGEDHRFPLCLATLVVALLTMSSNEARRAMYARA